MSIVNSESAIAFAPQTGLGTDVGYGAGDAAKSKLAPLNFSLWRWHPATSLAFTVAQDQRPLPQEFGGSLLPRNTYKSGTYLAGRVSLIPRIAGSHLHWFLWSACSSMSVVRLVDGTPKDVWDYYYGAGDTYDGTSGSGSNANTYARYLSVKQLLPRDENNNYAGMAASDVRVAGMTLTATPDSPLMLTTDLVGRVPRFYDASSVMSGGNLTSSWNPQYADLPGGQPGIASSGTFVLGCKGSLQLPTGTPLDLTTASATITVSPILTTPDDERNLFSYYPERYTIRSWNVTVELTVRRLAYTMFQNIFFNGGSTWSPVVWQNGQPFSIRFETSSDTVFAGYAGFIEFWAKNITWTMAPIPFNRPGDILDAVVTGIVEVPSDGKEAWYLRVRNGRDPDKNENGATAANYMKTWPTTYS